MLTDDDLRVLAEIFDALKPEDIADSDAEDYPGHSKCWNEQTTLLDLIREYLGEDSDLYKEVEKNERLRELRCADRCREMGSKDAQMVTFLDADGNPITVFQGTKSSGDIFGADKDLCFGGSDTERQKKAEAYIRKIHERYKPHPITVTGHSLGGNLAEYVTIVCGDLVARCVAFNAPGFSLDFIEAHKYEIMKNRGKITRYDTSGDFVSALLTQIVPATTIDDENGFLEDGNIFSRHVMSDFGYLGSAIRDFSDAKKDELLRIIQKLDDETFWEIHNWQDCWPNIDSARATLSEFGIGGNLDSSQYTWNIWDYVTDVHDKHAVIAEAINNRFWRANEFDWECSDKISNELSGLAQSIMNKLEELNG